MKSNVKKQSAKVLSKVVKGVAQKSAKAGCDWIFFQPQVPAKLKK